MSSRYPRFEDSEDGRPVLSDFLGFGMAFGTVRRGIAYQKQEIGRFSSHFGADKRPEGRLIRP
jgi:hypothetical protein